MKTYIAQRLAIGLLTLLGMSIVIFGMLRLAPGDIVDILFSTGGYVNPAERAAIERELGLDRPVWVQYLEWLRQIVTGGIHPSQATRLKMMTMPSQNEGMLSPARLNTRSA